MGQFVWIVSYPRSGNTFVRALLSSYLAEVPGGGTVAELPTRSIGEGDEPLWTELTGQTPAAREFARQWRARPAYFEAQRHRRDGVVLVKSHTPNVMAYGTPAFDFGESDKVIHVVRNPCDVAVSTAAYRGLTLNEAIDVVLQHDTIIDARPTRGFEVIGSWGQHATSWTKGVGAPVHRVRYFELVNDTVATLKAILGFLEMPFDEARAQVAVAACSFEQMVRQERSGGFAEAEMVRSGAFFRVGRPLQFLAAMDEAQIDRVIQPLKAVIEDMGFGTFLRKSGVRLG